MELKTKKGHFVVCTQVASLPTVVLATDLDLFCKQYIHQGSRRSHTYLLWVAGPPALVWLWTLCQPVIWLQSLSPKSGSDPARPGICWESCLPIPAAAAIGSGSSHMQLQHQSKSHYLDTRPEKIFPSQTTPTSVRT